MPIFNHFLYDNFTSIRLGEKLGMGGWYAGETTCAAGFGHKGSCCAVGLPMLQDLGARGAQASGACGVMHMNQEQNLLSAVCLLHPLLIKPNIMPAGKEKLKASDPIWENMQ